MDKYGNNFKKIIKIDTTSTDRREGTTRITQEVLNTLYGFLDSKILVIPKNNLHFELPESGFITDVNIINYFCNEIKDQKISIQKSKAERDSRYIIPIPCAFVTYQNKVLILRRKEEGHALHNTYAVWAGGHMQQSDDQGNDVIISTLTRELSEELFIKDDYNIIKIPLGLVRTNKEGKRALRHIGIVYKIELSTPSIALALDQKEFRETRGRSVSGRLIEIGKLREYYNDMGDWSKFIVDNQFPEQQELF